MKNRKLIDSLATTLLALPIAVSLALAPVTSAHSFTPPPAASAQARAEFSQQELDQMLAPIALYPDSLLSQILMAATYPLEVVQAARWSHAAPGLQGDQAVRAVEQKDWDPSVKSLVAFPQILAMMEAKLDWTEQLGDAFIAQEAQVMDTVQNLRQRAYAAGNLRSDDQIRVVPQGPAIVVEPANPQVVHVPYYDPTVVYGSWWWPAPPVYWAPWRGYHAAHPGFFLSWGAGIPVASGFFFGAFDWSRRHARVVDVHNYHYNRTVVINRQVNVHDNPIVRNVNTAPGVWRHDPAHRRGAPYRDAGVRARFIPVGAQINMRAERPAAPPQARAIDNGTSAVRVSTVRADEHKGEAARRAEIRVETRTESRNDDRRRQETAARIEPRNEARQEVDRQNNRRTENHTANRIEPRQAARPEISNDDNHRHDASVRAEHPRPPEIRRATPRAESAVRPAPAAVPQPRVEATRPATLRQATPAQPAQESRQLANGPRPRHSGGG